MSPITFDLNSPEAKRDPYPYYRALREQAPVHHFAQQDYWSVTRWADVVAVLQSPERFSSVINTVFDKLLVGADPPAHTRVKRIVARAFSARAIANLETTIRTVARKLLDDIASRGRCDLMADFAVPLPHLVMATMLGIDLRYVDRLAEWTGEALGGSNQASEAERRRWAERLGAFHAFLAESVDRARAHPSDGLISSVLQPNAQGECLTREEAIDFAKVLLIAGSETTTNLMGNAVLALLQHPGEMKLVRENPALIPAMIEESLRYDSPVQRTWRQATGEQEISGVLLPPGAQVMILLGSANRDPAQFTDPDRFSISRNPKEVMSLGIGPHYCLGARLARLEARIAFEALFERLGALRAAQSLEKVTYLDIIRIRGLKSLELAFETGSRTNA